MAANWKFINRRWEELKALRLPREAEWQQIADVFMPRKTMECTPVPGELRRRRVTTSVPQTQLAASAAMLVSYLIDPTRPSIKPNTARGLLQAGRRTELDAEGLDYLENLGWSMFDRMMLPQSGFFGALSRCSLELQGFGTGVVWTGRKRGFGPRYMTRPLRSCWIGENDEGETDTNYFRWTSPAWRVLERYPEARKNDKLLKLGLDEKTQQTPVTLLHAVEPRAGGIMGGVATNKLFASVTMAPDFADAVLEESGFESFPYAIPRLNVEEGSAYGTGLAWMALPDALVLNRLQQMVEKGVEVRVDPPMFAPNRLFGKPLDRRAGALNVYDEMGLGFQNLKDAIQYLPVGGDVGIGVDYMKMLEDRIGRVFLTDWMKLRDSGAVTAEEIIERRNLRIRALGAYVPNVDRDLMGVIGDRTLQVMLDEDQLPPPPEALRGVDVDWDYAGPLAVAQQQGQVESVSKMIDLATRASAVDPDVTSCLAIEEGLRAAAEGLAVPAGVMRSRADTANRRAAMEEARAADAQAQQLAQVGAAFRDGSQGAATLVGAQPQAQAA